MNMSILDMTKVFAAFCFFVVLLGGLLWLLPRAARLELAFSEWVVTTATYRRVRGAVIWTLKAVLWVVLAIVAVVVLLWVSGLTIPLWLIVVFVGLVVVYAIENEGNKTRDAINRANHPYDDW